MKQRRPAPSRAPSLIIGIGASAGGLDAFKRFFAHMPADSGMAFVLVQHLDPHHNSLLVELIGRQTAMTVVEAANNASLAANHVFVIPPDATLTISGGVLRVKKPAPARQYRRPIDTFFSSLAQDQGEKAVCIVLSGIGSDGTLGLTSVKEHGGLTLAQAEFDSTAMSGMPFSAAATGLVDHIIPVEDMPATLIDYQQHLTKVAGRKNADGTRGDMAAHLTAINTLLRAATGHDFSQYKQNTLIRRIQRRMQVLNIDNTPGFIERLRKDPGQIDLLFREFLIGVTQFFRDPQIFDVLQAAVIPKLLENKSSDDQVRIWIPGCATGEEVYSIAILLQEAMERQGIAPRVQIFGTDIDDAAIAYARGARYRKSMTGVSPERLERWFAMEGDEYCPIRAVREMCIFSTHSVVKDPPFSRLDLISCRNLLIYLDANLQDRVMQTFHYALLPQAYLCLGQSEGITRNTKLFATVDKKHRIFQRRDVPAAALPSFSVATPKFSPQPGQPATRPPARSQDRLDGAIRRVMDKHSPAYVVIDRHQEILRFSGGEVGRYLEPSPGMANLNLFSIVRKALRPAVRTVVQKAQAANEPATVDSAPIKIGGRARTIRLIAEPIPDGGEAGFYIVAFQEIERAAKGPAGSTHPDLHALEQELLTTRAQLRATIDELETSNEEMKSANEEYQSVNEELQSSNEELETAKEEMQSINEELQTINAEMSSKNESLTHLNSDLKNLLDSTQIATIFLDSKLRIKNFTPSMVELFHLRESDHGRPITDIVTRMNYADMRRDVANVLRNLAVVEHELQLAEDGRYFIMRIRPYRTVDNVIDGVVITFIDVTERKHREEAQARLASIVEFSDDAIIGHGFDGLIRSWNAGAEKLFGFSAQDAIGKPMTMLLPEEDADDVPQVLERLQRSERVEHFEVDRIRKDGKRIDVSLTISPVKDAAGNMIAASTVAREFTKRKIAEEQKTLLVAELDHRIKNTLTIVTALVSQTLKVAQSPEMFAERIEGRIQSLSRAHQVLTQNKLDSANLRDVVEGELAPYRTENGKNIAFNALADVILTPKSTLTLAMALHEMATNAAKYGSLSTDEGKLTVSWHVAESVNGPLLSIDWVESGGPPVTPPTRRGFGSRLIDHTLSHDLQATVQKDFAPQGIRYRIEFALTSATGSLRSESETANGRDRGRDPESTTDTPG